MRCCSGQKRAWHEVADSTSDIDVPVQTVSIVVARLEASVPVRLKSQPFLSCKRDPTRQMTVQRADRMEIGKVVRGRRIRRSISGPVQKTQGIRGGSVTSSCATAGDANPRLKQARSVVDKKPAPKTLFFFTTLSFLHFAELRTPSRLRKDSNFATVGALYERPFFLESTKYGRS